MEENPQDCLRLRMLSPGASSNAETSDDGSHRTVVDGNASCTGDAATFRL
jgi:hypothetical protein